MPDYRLVCRHRHCAHNTVVSARIFDRKVYVDVSSAPGWYVAGPVVYCPEHAPAEVAAL